jgi:hypothetical protein
MIADLIVGPVWFRLLLVGRPADPESVGPTLDALIAGLTP